MVTLVGKHKFQYAQNNVSKLGEPSDQPSLQTSITINLSKARISRSSIPEANYPTVVDSDQLLGITADIGMLRLGMPTGKYLETSTGNKLARFGSLEQNFYRALTDENFIMFEFWVRFKNNL